MRSPPLVIALTSALVSVAPGSSGAQSASEAERHLARGLELYRARDYERAIGEFEAGYAIEPRREFLFALAQAERLSGDCQSALVYYQSFLSRRPPARQARAAKQNAARCRAALAEGPDGRRRYVPKRPALSKLRASEHPRGSTPWYRDALTATTIAGATTASIASAAMVLSMYSASQAADRASTYEAYDEALGRARARRDWAVTTGAVAVGLAGLAAYRLSRGRSRPTAAAITAAPAAGSGSLSLVVGGRF